MTPSQLYTDTAPTNTSYSATYDWAKIQDMVGSDFYCTLSGSLHFDATDEFLRTIEGQFPGYRRRWDDFLYLYESDETDDSQDDEDGVNPDRPHLKRRLRRGLLYLDEDVAYSSNFVMICPYVLQGNEKVITTDYGTKPLKDYGEHNITEVFDVVPGESPQYGEYRSGDNDYTVGSGSVSYIINYASFRILKQAAPQLKTWMIYEMLFSGRPCPNGHGHLIDYGPVNKIATQFVSWLSICNSKDPKNFWKNLVTRKDISEAEILREAWKGAGNMWVFKRPDRFPIDETLSATPLAVFPFSKSLPLREGTRATFHSLPLDVLIAICELVPVKTTHMLLNTSWRVRAPLLPHTHMIAYRHLQSFEPHLIPIPLTAHNDDFEWWEAKWVAGGLKKEGLDNQIPWFLYRQECSKSMSMWNRRRIWNVVKQFEAQAVQRGLIDDITDF